MSIIPFNFVEILKLIIHLKKQKSWEIYLK